MRAADTSNLITLAMSYTQSSSMFIAMDGVSEIVPDIRMKAFRSQREVQIQPYHFLAIGDSLG